MSSDSHHHPHDRHHRQHRQEPTKSSAHLEEEDDALDLHSIQKVRKVG